MLNYGDYALLKKFNEMLEFDKNNSYCFAKWYEKDETIGYKIPHILDILYNEKDNIENGLKGFNPPMVQKTVSFGNYSVDCISKFESLIDTAKSLHKDNDVKYFVLKMRIKQDENDFIKKEDIDLLYPKEVKRTVARYKMCYNEDKSGVVLEMDHEEQVYELYSATLRKVMQGVKEFTLDRTVDLENVKLKNVFNFIKYPYFFGEKDVPRVNELIKNYQLYTCEKCNRIYYIPDQYKKFLEEHNFAQTCLCPKCEKARREK